MLAEESVDGASAGGFISWRAMQRRHGTASSARNRAVQCIPQDLVRKADEHP